MEKLKELRTASRKTQEELGKYLKVGRNTISRYESGEREPDLKTAQKIADYFGVSTDYLLGKSDTPQQKKPTPIEGLAADISAMLVERGIVGEDETLTPVQREHLLLCFDTAADLFKKLKEQG